MRAAVIAALSLLASCTTTQPVMVADGSGFSKGHPKDSTRALLINEDIDFYRWYRGHEETCDKQPGCEK